MIRYSADPLFLPCGTIECYSVYDNFTQEYVGHTFRNRWECQDICTDMNNEYEIEFFSGVSA